LGFRVQGTGFRVQGLGQGGLGFSVWSVWGLGVWSVWRSGAVCGVFGVGGWVWSVWGWGLGVGSHVEGRAHLVRHCGQELRLGVVRRLTEEGLHLRLIDFCITQPQVQGPSRT